MAMRTQTTHGEDEESDSIVAEINITPLVDVFLVLLIIFMVTSSVISQMGMDVQLPQATASSSSAAPEGVIVTLLPGGGMKVNDTPVPARDYAQLERLLGQLLPQTTGKTVILAGDRQSYLGAAIEVMDHARKAGATNFSIATSLKTE